MCGIVGYIGDRQACPILLKGLHRLEYRGYVCAECLMPVIASIPLQLLAYYVAVYKGRNVDQP